ncbi:NUDIX hydrolase [Salinimicrobium tongyeongense]|jgi:8-oxo-dGTP diphosphatase|uniref:NUDIX hydrolase n=1 Tax=Salinimicrobium tongyeongense TaxID=2809707 RepID=A0ABY6NQ61_9FLAO|nr:NUDIX hydrolase [Salinimicrobium tongyeongense]UZH55041.1 NUDIX hydrolase [Salinimicrobium tongyeongense]
MARQNISVTTDCVIFFSNNGRPKVLLVKRKKDPFKDQWALPGGFLEDEEPLEDGAKRELEEETGLKVGRLKQLQAFGTPGRDPRGRTISITFWGEVTSEEKVEGNDDAADARWFLLSDLPELAFDHSEILQAAREAFLGQND